MSCHALFTNPSLYYDYDPCLHEVFGVFFLSIWVGSIGSGIPLGWLVGLACTKPEHALGAGIAGLYYRMRNVCMYKILHYR